MMRWLLLVAFVVPAQSPPLQWPIDAAALKAGAPTRIAEFDLSALKGEPRRLSWAPDLSQLYLQTVEAKPPSEKVHHFTIAVAGGVLKAVEGEPDWATAYWTVKQDRVAPGIPSLQIEIEQKVETLKLGPGSAGVLDRQSTPTAVAANNPSPESLANGQHGDQPADVVRLKLVGEEIAVWVNDRPRPGMRFGWGPAGSGALVFVGEGGSLVFLDRNRHRQRLPGVKDALLPAWSSDGTRLAFLQKTGRKRMTLAWVSIDRAG